MKKKILALCLVVVLAVTAVTGVTLAYFTDNEQVTNTMVIGNVDINIEELTWLDEDGDGVREDDEWDKFENDEFVLYPIDEDQGSDLYNKMVYTVNTSTSKDDAYIRNIILFEHNDKAKETDCFNGLHYSYADEASGNDHASSVEDKGVWTIGDKKYDVVVFTAADKKAIPFEHRLRTLISVWMDKDVTQEQIEGWGEDNKVDIIVFSQGIQAEGLSHDEAMAALGEVNLENVQNWLNGNEEKNIDAAPEGVINDSVMNKDAVNYPDDDPVADGE